MKKIKCKMKMINIKMMQLGKFEITQDMNINQKTLKLNKNSKFIKQRNSKKILQIQQLIFQTGKKNVKGWENF